MGRERWDGLLANYQIKRSPVFQMPLETHQVFEASARAQGHKGLSASTQLALATTYARTTPYEARDPMTPDEIQRITWMFEANATRGGEGKVANVLGEVYFTELFDRLNRHESPTALTCELAVTKAQELCEHFAGVLKACRPGFVPDEVAIEAAEMLVALRDVIKCAEAADDKSSGAESLRLPARLRA
jgi:hypothetical protein